MNNYYNKINIMVPFQTPTRRILILSWWKNISREENVTNCSIRKNIYESIWSMNIHFYSGEVLLKENKYIQKIFIFINIINEFPWSILSFCKSSRRSATNPKFENLEFFNKNWFRVTNTSYNFSYFCTTYYFEIKFMFLFHYWVYRQLFFWKYRENIFKIKFGLLIFY